MFLLPVLLLLMDSRCEDHKTYPPVINDSGSYAARGRNKWQTTDYVVVANIS